MPNKLKIEDIEKVIGIRVNQIFTDKEIEEIEQEVNVKLGRGMGDQSITETEQKELEKSMVLLEEEIVEYREKQEEIKFSELKIKSEPEYFRKKIVHKLEIAEGIEKVGISVYSLNDNSYGVEAWGELYNNKYFKVLKGSRMNIRCQGDAAKESKCHEMNKEQCIARTLEQFGGAVINVDNRYYEFVEDFVFKNARIAAEFIKGYPGVRGNPWTDRSGNNLKDTLKNYKRFV